MYFDFQIGQCFTFLPLNAKQYSEQAHQVFVKMPQRSFAVESTKPTPLRRSRRLLQLQQTANSQNPTSKNNQVHPISELSPISCSSTPGSRSRSGFRKNPHGWCPENFSKDSSESEGKRNCPEKSSKGLKESTDGSLKCGKSVNKSLRKSSLNGKLEGYEEPRRSPRFCNKINSGDFDRSPMSFRSLKQKIRSEVETSPITPIGMGEKKSRSGDLSNLRYSMSESKPQRMSRLNGKESGSGSSEIIVCGLASCSFNFTPRSTPGSRQAREHKLKANHEKETGSGELVMRDFEKMITRSASKCMRERDDSHKQIVETRSKGNSSRNVARKAASALIMKEKQRAIGSLTTVTGQPLKRVTHNSVKTPSIRPEEETGSQGIDGNKKKRCELGKECRDARPLLDDPGTAENKKQVFSKDTKLTGCKRKRKQTGIQGTVQGWTKDQEVALQRAYFAVIPSPHFWNKVAKLVPGKSAQECFDKVQSDNLTPLSTRRSRAKRVNSPTDLGLSDCNLFKSAGTKCKKSRRTKPKSHVTRRTVRHLLQKHCQVNQDNEADLFSILEPTVNSSVEVLQLHAFQSTPEHLMGSPASSSKGCKGSSSGYKKSRSRFSGANKSPLTSPPVLKKVKNLALHEKYIDQLHKREAKRKVQSTRHVKVAACQENGKNPVAPKDVIRAAKDALVSDARDAINKFRDSQANIMNAFSDSEEEGLTNEDVDEDEDGIVP